MAAWSLDRVLEWTVLAVALVNLGVDFGILWYVKREYEESRELNMKLNKVYRSKRKRVNATQLVKAVIAQEAPSDA